MDCGWYQPPQTPRYSRYYQPPQHLVDSKWYAPAPALQDEEWISSEALEQYKHQRSLRGRKRYQSARAGQLFQGFPPQRYQENFEWYSHPQYKEDYEGCPPPHAQQDPEYYHPPQDSPPLASTRDIANMLHQLLDAQNACLQDIRKTLKQSTEELPSCADTVLSNIPSEEDYLTEDEAKTHQLTEDSDNQVGGDNLTQEEVEEDTLILESPSSPPDPTPTLERIIPTMEPEQRLEPENREVTPPATQNKTTTKEKSKALVPPPYEQYIPFPQRSKEVMEAQCEVLFNYKTHKLELTSRDMSKSSSSPPHKESDYIMKAPMYEEVIDGESLQDMFAWEETANSPPEKLCNVPAIDPKPDILVRPLECISGEIEIVDEPLAENEETAHLSLMKIVNSVPINATMSEEKPLSFTTAECQSLGKDSAKATNIFMIKLHQDEEPQNNSTLELNQHKFKLCSTKHQICSVTGMNLHSPEEKPAGIFRPRYADLTNHLVVENMANKLDQHLEKEHFENANYSFWDEPTLCKRGFDDSFGSHLHTKTKRCKRLLDCYMPTQKPNVYGNKSKLCSPKVKMKSFLNEVSKWVSPGNDEPKGEKDPPWKRQKVEMHFVTELERTSPPLPAPSPLPDPPPFPTSSKR